MLNLVTDGITKCIEKHLPNHKNQDPKGNVPQRPAVLECIKSQYKLHDYVYRNADCVQDVKHHEHTNGVGGTESSPRLESQEGDHERDHKHPRGCEPEEPDG